MKRAFFALPGPIPVKVIITVVLVVVFLVLLNFVYGWLGNILDSGGTVG